MQCTEGALTRDVSIYNSSGIVVVAVAAALAATCVAGRKGAPVGTPAVGAVAGASASLAGVAYVFGAPAFEFLFALHAAIACPLAVAWVMQLATRTSAERTADVCVAGMLSAGFSLACIGNDALLNAAALFPAVSGALLLAAAHECGKARTFEGRADTGAFSGQRVSGRRTATGVASGTGGRAWRERLFAYALCALVLCASVFCGITASPVSSNSSTPQTIMATVTIAGMAVLLAALGVFARQPRPDRADALDDAGRGENVAPEKTSAQVARLDIVLQLFAGAGSIALVAGLLLFSAAAAGTMTSAIGIICGVRQCLLCLCWIVFPQVITLSEMSIAPTERAGRLLLANGTLYALALGSLIDRACAFPFAQLLVVATASIAFVALLAIAYLSLYMRNLLANQAAEREARTQADDSGDNGSNTQKSTKAGEEASAQSSASEKTGIAEEKGDSEEATGAAEPPAVDAGNIKQQVQALRLKQVEPYGLTERETQIALLLLDGQTMRGIAEELFISERTVKFHSKNAYEKLGVSSKKELMQKFSDLPPAPTETLQPR